MKQAIQIGAGNIGRGFMGALLEQAGWHVTFADVVESIISEINTRKQYTVHVQDRDQQRQGEHDNTDRIKISMC